MNGQTNQATFYQQQVARISAETYPNPYLCRQIIQAKLFIDANFDSPLRLADIAGEAFFSPFHFIRLFRKFYGKTPHQYLIDVRIKNARHLLLTGKPVKEVCFSVGFDSPSSFTGLFKKMTGLTPSEFSANQKRINAYDRSVCETIS